MYRNGVPNNAPPGRRTTFGTVSHGLLFSQHYPLLLRQNDPVCCQLAHMVCRLSLKNPKSTLCQLMWIGTPPVR